MWGWKFRVPNFMEQDYGGQNVSLGPGLRLSLDSGGRPGVHKPWDPTSAPHTQGMEA